MIIWTGLGILVAVATFLSALVTEWGIERVYADDQYYQTHGWPKLVGMVLAAILVKLLDRALRARQTETRIDAVTGGRVTVVAGQAHSLFFIPLRFWPPILLVVGFIHLFARE